jgi:hypothetical protein
VRDAKGRARSYHRWKLLQELKKVQLLLDERFFVFRRNQRQHFGLEEEKIRQTNWAEFEGRTFSVAFVAYWARCCSSFARGTRPMSVYLAQSVNQQVINKAINQTHHMRASMTVQGEQIGIGRFLPARES